MNTTGAVGNFSIDVYESISKILKNKFTYTLVLGGLFLTSIYVSDQQNSSCSSYKSNNFIIIHGAIPFITNIYLIVDSYLLDGLASLCAGTRAKRPLEIAKKVAEKSALLFVALGIVSLSKFTFSNMWLSMNGNENYTFSPCPMRYFST